MSREWTLTELTAVIPLLASGFAFAYVVGYFFAFDLAWFPFFSLSEHIVFAIRALPVAVTASVALLIFAEAPTLLLRARRAWIWFMTLVAVLAVTGLHVGLAASFAVLAFGTSIHDMKSDPNTPTVLYWVAHLMLASLIIGFISGGILKLDSYLPVIPPLFPLARTIHVHLKEDGGTTAHLGHVVFVGDTRLLFFEYTSHHVTLYEREAIKELHESRSDER